MGSSPTSGETTDVRITVAMSGGVDSLRAAAELKGLGHEVTAAHMRILPESASGRWCASAVQARREADLVELARWLSVPLVFIDLRNVFEELVLQPFIRAYLAGLTPNPCVLCNPLVKLGVLLDEAVGMGAEKLATGHYARILPPDGDSTRFRLLRGRDGAKDQSYFLYGLTQRQLASTLFPLGTTFKKDVVSWGEGTPVADRLSGESQDICFIPQGAYWEILTERAGIKGCDSHGPIVDLEGRVLGRHKGIAAYTVGQRRGLGIASTAPYYVVAIDAKANLIRVGRAEDLNRSEFHVGKVNWVSIEPPSRPLRAWVRIRNQHRPALALVTPEGGSTARIRLDTPQRAVTPGQAAVFYDTDVVLGGGIIQPFFDQDAPQGTCNESNRRS